MTAERLLMAGVMGVLVWAPWPLGSNRAWSAALLVVLVGLLLLAWGLLLLRDRDRGHWAPLRMAAPMLGLLLLAQLWVGVQLFTGWTTDPGASTEALALGLGYSGLFVLVVGLFKTRRRITLLLGVLLGAAVLQAFYASALVLVGLDWLPFGPGSTRVASGAYINRNHLAGFLAMSLGLGIALLLALREDREFRWYHIAGLLIGPKAWVRLALVILVIALVMTQSRMGNTAFFTSLVLVGALFVALTPRNRLRNGAVLVSVLVIDALVISQWFGLEELQQRIADTRFQDEVVDDQIVRRENVTRDNIVLYAWPQFLERPVVGFGAGGFDASFQRFPGEDITRRWNHAHNDYLEFAIEYGVVGLVPLIGFVLLALWHALRAMAAHQSLYRSGLATGVMMGLVALLIHGVTDFNLQIPANAALFVVLAALAPLARSHRVQRKGTAVGRRRSKL